MRKRRLPGLLTLALFLSIAPVSAYASTANSPMTMTLVQQTTGEFADVNKEFVYYIDHCYMGSVFAGVDDLIEFEIDTDAYPNVTTIYHNIYWCAACGDSVTYDDLIPEQMEELFHHQIANRHGTTENYQKLCYKIPLKNGEKVEITVKDLGNKKLYMAREDSYSLSVIANGKEQTFAQESEVSILEFNPEENGTVIVKRTNGKESEDTTTTANPYTDVSITDWFWPAVEYMSGRGYMTGYSDTEFSPRDTLSRAMFVTILYRIAGEKVNAEETRFTDVPQDTWYTEAVAWAVANGITSGTGDTTFSPDDPVTREQMATFIERYVNSKALDLGAKHRTGEPDDLADGNTWGRNAMARAYEYGLLFTTNGKAYPLNNATRTDAVVAFHNLLCWDALVLFAE